MPKTHCATSLFTRLPAASPLPISLMSTLSTASSANCLWYVQETCPLQLVQHTGCIPQTYSQLLFSIEIHKNYYAWVETTDLPRGYISLDLDWLISASRFSVLLA